MADVSSDLLSKDPRSFSPSEAVEWAKKIYESGNQDDYINAWMANSQGAGNLPNVYRQQYYDAYKTFRDVVGRDPSSTEYGQVYGSFVEQPNRNTGVQLVSNIAAQEANKPSALSGKAPQYANQVKGVFQSVMGRDPNADELDYFGRQLATGEVGSYELGNFLKNTQEYQDKADTAFRSSVGQELIPQQQEVFNKAKEGIIARYNRMGTQNSPALDFALTNLLGELEKGRQGFLTNLKVNQYGGNKAAAQADYGNMLNNYLGTVNANRAQSQNMLNALNQRAWQNADYVTQRNDYLNALNSQRRSAGNPLGAMIGGAGAGASIGSAFGPPGAAWGAAGGALYGLGNNYGWFGG